MSLNIIKKRRDFLAVAATRRRWITQNFIIQAKPGGASGQKSPVETSEDVSQSSAIQTIAGKQQADMANGRCIQKDKNLPRFGFTVSKKVGNAVQRNRVRRRLKEVVRLSGSGLGISGWDYVLIGRRQDREADFDHLKRDLKWGMTKLHQQADLVPRALGQAGVPNHKSAPESKA